MPISGAISEAVYQRPGMQKNLCRAEAHVVGTAKTELKKN